MPVMVELKCPNCGYSGDDCTISSNSAQCDHCGHEWSLDESVLNRIAAEQSRIAEEQPSFSPPIRLTDMLPLPTIRCMQAIVKDAKNFKYIKRAILVLLLCSSTLRLLRLVALFVALTGCALLQVRFVQGYFIRRKYSAQLRAACNQPPEPFGEDRLLAIDFLTAANTLWINAFLWPGLALAALVLLVARRLLQ